ncbi:MAG: glycoside hydrolase family 97 protein [Saprospiraceae bacterium]|nr:glycoside hydrolase family 97 protein [Saprospiraceae bacterium]
MFRYLIFLSFLVAGCKSNKIVNTITSPNKQVSLNVNVDAEGKPYYEVSFDGQPAINRSYLGLVFREMDMTKGFEVVNAVQSSYDDTWEPVLGEVARIREHYNQLTVSLKNKEGRTMDVFFRVFEDGLGFRYQIPHQQGLDTVTTEDEISEFAMTGDHKTWWIPGDYDSNEHVYSTTAISKIDAFAYNAPDYEKKIYTQHIVLPNAVQTPLAMKAQNGVHFCLHEAALKDFPALHLRVIRPNTFKASLIPSKDSTIKSVNTLPLLTPWRSINISKDAAGLLTSKLILNLNDPCAIKETNWIKPQKYVGIWWEMHIGKSTWEYGVRQASNQSIIKPHGRHGATTENTKRYIDFAAAHGFDGVLVEGWNQGWEDWFGKWQDSVFSFTSPYPDYDLDYLAKYAREKGTRLIMHHETSSAVTNYESQMKAAFDVMNTHDVTTVKTGYVGKIIPKGEWHDGQWMVNHYLRVATSAADHKIMVNMHESHRPAGMNRTYPNWLSCEASRGMEFNAWSAGNPPEHETILPFTRIMGGGFDYTPGIFETRMNVYNKDKKEIVHTTVAKQLALYVTLYSPLIMAADLPENYSKRLDIFQFIKDVPADWQDTRILNAKIGDYLTVARKDKRSENWFLGSITDENARQYDVTLDFLDEGFTYDATVYEDGEGAHWQNNPYPVRIRKVVVKKGDQLPLRLADGGGVAVSIMKRK